MRRYITWLETQLRKAEIPVRFYTEGNEETVSALKPDAIIWAVGGKENRPDIEGLELPNVYHAVDALLSRCYVGKRVLVVGGGMTGVETALQLDKTGHEVICAARAFPAKPGFKMNDELLRDLMAASGVRFLSGTRLRKIDGDVLGCSATLTRGEETVSVDCDTVLLALGSAPQAASGLEAIAPVTVIGDADRGGKIIDAVHAAWNAIRDIT